MKNCDANPRSAPSLPQRAADLIVHPRRGLSVEAKTRIPRPAQARPKKGVRAGLKAESAPDLRNSRQRPIAFGRGREATGSRRVRSVGFLVHGFRDQTLQRAALQERRHISVNARL